MESTKTAIRTKWTSEGLGYMIDCGCPLCLYMLATNNCKLQLNMQLSFTEIHTNRKQLAISPTDVKKWFAAWKSTNHSLEKSAERYILPVIRKSAN